MIKHTMLKHAMIKHTAIACMSLLLGACGASQDDDLTQFMQETRQATGGKIEPLPAVQAFIPRQYNADHSLHDPFVPRKAALQLANQPDLKRPREPLEAYPLESLKFVGIMSRKQKTFAMIQTPDSMIYQVKPGHYMGQKLGLVTSLTENSQTAKYELKIKETVQDTVSGEWSAQMTTLELQEHQ